MQGSENRWMMVIRRWDQCVVEVCGGDQCVNRNLDSTLRTTGWRSANS